MRAIPAARVMGYLLLTLSVSRGVVLSWERVCSWEPSEVVVSSLDSSFSEATCSSSRSSAGSGVAVGVAPAVLDGVAVLEALAELVAVALVVASVALAGGLGGISVIPGGMTSGPLLHCHPSGVKRQLVHAVGVAVELARSPSP